MRAFSDPQTPSRLLMRACSGELTPLRANRKLPTECVGLSGRCFRNYVQHLVNTLNCGCYLEIGIYKGYTLLSSAYVNPSTHHVGVDNFSQFDGDGVNRRIVEAGSVGLANIQIVDQDYEDFLTAHLLAPNSVGVYFFDATHDYRSQLLGVALGRRLLLPGSIILVDDANYHHVRYACYDLMNLFPEIKLIGELFTPTHPNKMSPQQRRECLRGWWNGCIIMQYDPESLLPATCLRPQTSEVFRSMITKNLHKGRSGYDTSTLKNQVYHCL